MSMGWTAGLQLRAVRTHVAAVLAIEALCAAQALDLRAPLAPAAGTARRAATPCGPSSRTWTKIGSWRPTSPP